jgi:multicomponent Na+:H+ antiporter subunit F
MTTVHTIVFLLLAAALVLAFIRLARGPSLPDRVVALDLLAAIIAGAITAAVVWFGQPLLLDVVTLMAVISFFGTVAVARYLERRPRDDE